MHTRTDEKASNQRHTAATVPIACYCVLLLRAHAHTISRCTTVRSVIEHVSPRALDSCTYDHLCGRSTDDKRTALHVAASEGNRATVSFLLEQGASVNALDRWSGTPLHDAVREGRVEVAQMLCEAGGLLRYDKEKESGTLCEFARAGNLEAIGRLLTSGCGVNADDYDKRTCLHLAASEGNIRIAELLLEHGADIDSRDRCGEAAGRHSSHTVPSSPMPLNVLPVNAH